MAANIESMMYYGETPWHKMGTEVSKAQTSAEAIIAAGMDWEVEKKPIIVSTSNGMVEIPGKFATMRKDRETPLGVVGKVYQPLQNKEAFSFFDKVVGGEYAMFHTAGVLGQGEKIWMLAKLPGHIVIGKDDVTEKYLLLSNSHDGSSPVQVMFTPIRVVCQNTLNVALSSGTSHKIRHSGLLMSKWEDVRTAMGLVNYQYQAFEDAAKAMANKQLNSIEVESFLKNVFAMSQKEALSTRSTNILTEVTQMFEKGKGNDMEGIKGSAWAAFNAVAEYVDYGRSNNKENAVNSLLFGSGRDIKQKAWDEALVYVRR